MCIAHTPARGDGDVQHARVAGQSRDVVDDLGAGGQRRFGDDCFRGIDGDRQIGRAADLFDDRNHPSQFFVRGNG